MTFQELLEHVVVKEAMIKKLYRLNDYVDYLNSGGWREIGSGSYGVVLGKRGKNYVLKVYDDQAYDAYLQYLEMNKDNNPHLVKVRRYIINDSKEGDFLGVVAIEKLNPIISKNGQYNWIRRIVLEFAEFLNTEKTSSFNRAIDKFRRRYYENNKDSKTVEGKKSIRRLDFFIENYLPIAKTLYDISDFVSSEIFMDLHQGNFMIRPSTNEIVITDPLALIKSIFIFEKS